MIDKELEEEDGGGFIDPKEYQETVDILATNKDVILKELKNLLKNNIDWSVWDEANYSAKKDHFSKSSNEDILRRLDKIKKNPEKEKEIWTLFGLILDTNKIKKNIIQMPETMNILGQIPNLLNAGFSCLTPNSSTKLHNEKDKVFLRKEDGDWKIDYMAEK